MTMLIWGVVLLHEQPTHSLTFPSQVSILYSGQEEVPAENDPRWQAHSQSDIELSNEVRWLKFTLAFNVTSNGSQGVQQTESAPKGLFVSILGAFSVYLNGYHIGDNGMPATAESKELPGEIDSIFILPSHHLNTGDNTVMVRLSSEFRPDTAQSSGFWVFADDFETLAAINEWRIRLPLMMLSGLVLVAMYSFVVYFSSLKEPAYLWFSCLCTMLILLILAESWRGLFGYSYQWHILRMEIVLGLTLVISLVLPLFFLSFFRYSKTWFISTLLVLVMASCGVLLYFDGYDYRSFLLFSVSLLISFIIGVASIYKRKKYAWLMTMGIVVFVSPVLINRFSFMDQYFFVSFSGLALLLLLVLSQTHAERQRALTQSTLTTQRLQLELIKKQLQPHFILNTLTAIEEWIEIAPKEAIGFIQALASEFRQMASLSDRALIALQQEVALCESHLKIMGYRFDAHFSLQKPEMSENIGQQLIPPGVLLTLIENAFSHNRYGSGEDQFSLSFSEQQEDEAQGVSVENAKHDKNKRPSTTLLFKAQLTQHYSYQTSALENKEGTGVGTKYIKARLTEAFGNNWKLVEFIGDRYWVTKLTFPTTFVSGEQSNAHAEQTEQITLQTL